MKLLHLSLFFSIFCAIIKTNAQEKKWHQLWSEIEQLEMQGKVTSALEKVEKLLDKTDPKTQQNDFLKALLFKWKFQQLIDEKSAFKIIEDIDVQINQTSFPTKQILQTYKAQFLESYLNKNFWCSLGFV